MWYVMRAVRWGWDTYMGPFDSEVEAQRALRDNTHKIIDPLRVMKVK